MEFELTGIMKQSFLNDYGEYKVCNFFVSKGGYYSKKEQKFINYRYPFEAWLDDLIKKVQKIPPGEIVTVRFEIIPKDLQLEDRRISNNVVLRAKSITHWNKKKEKNEGEEAEQIEQMELNFNQTFEG